MKKTTHSTMANAMSLSVNGFMPQQKQHLLIGTPYPPKAKNITVRCLGE